MNILIVRTGGTIDCSIECGLIGLGDKSSGFRVLELYKSIYGDCNFDIIQPLNLLSENLTPSDWETMVNTIRHTDTSRYDGVILTHGSDTLSYTSAMMGLCLCAFNIPIVITGANYVPDNPKSNALKNIRCAVRVIENFRGGVFAVFCDTDEHAVYIPTRLCEADRFFDRFSSCDGRCIADLKGDRLVFASDIPSTETLENGLDILHDDLKLKKRVLMIRPYPGLDYKNISIDENTGAILHVMYHSATAKSDGENSAMYLLEQCKKGKIPFFCASFKNSGNIYESSAPLLNEGAIPLCGISNESAYAKLLLACAQKELSLQDFMKREIYFETVK